jgi:hypothetical protein
VLKVLKVHKDKQVQQVLRGHKGHKGFLEFQEQLGHKEHKVPKEQLVRSQVQLVLKGHKVQYRGQQVLKVEYKERKGHLVLRDSRGLKEQMQVLLM